MQNNTHADSYTIILACAGSTIIKNKNLKKNKNNFISIAED
jgi:hypothetical protein